MTSFDIERRNQNDSVDKSFIKSEFSSKVVIDTMSQFYESKHHKKT